MITLLWFASVLALPSSLSPGGSGRTSDAGVPAYGVDDWTNQSLLLSLTCWAAMGPCAVQP